MPPASTTETPGRESLAAVDRPRRSAVPLIAWFALVVTGALLVELVRTPERNIRINAPPLVGVFRGDPMDLTLVAVAVGLGLVMLAPGAAARLPWPGLLVAAAGAAALWAVAVAVGDGFPEGLLRPVEHPNEYLASVPLVGSPGALLATFTDRIRDYGIHVQGHPPGLLLALVGLDRIGLGGSGWTAGLFIAGGALAPPAALLAAREVAGELAARRAAPFLVIAPVTIWIASSADALFAGVSAWAVALVVLGTGRRGRSSAIFAVAGGLLFGITAMLSYGLVLLALVPVIVAARRRRLEVIGLACCGGIAVLLAFLAAGFWWFDGLLATGDRYFDGVGGRRPYWVFIVANLACLAIALGPALAVALARLRDRAAWLLVGGACAAIAIADVTGMSRGEVERIWIPFTPWILVAGLALFPELGRIGRRRAMGWLALQAGATIITQTIVNSPW